MHSVHLDSWQEPDTGRRPWRRSLSLDLICDSSEAPVICFGVTPKSLADSKYKEPPNVLHSPFQIGHSTNQPAFVWAMNHPELVEDFKLQMIVRCKGQESWLDVLRFEEFCRDLAPERAVFFVVAVGIGKQCLLLKTRFPSPQAFGVSALRPKVIRSIQEQEVYLSICAFKM